jgi:hypothetical protein
MCVLQLVDAGWQTWDIRNLVFGEPRVSEQAVRNATDRAMVKWAK